MSVIHCGWKIGQFFLVVNIKVLFHPPSISHFDLVERKKGKFCHDFFYWGHNLIFYVSHSPQCIIATFLIWPSNFYIINFTVEKCLSIFCWEWKLKIEGLIYSMFTLFEIFIFCPKIQLWFSVKIVDFLGEKLVKMLWFWTF